MQSSLPMSSSAHEPIFSARDKVCEGAEANAGTYQCDSSEIVIVIIGCLVAPALETQRFTRTNIPVCFFRVV